MPFLLTIYMHICALTIIIMRCEKWVKTLSSSFQEQGNSLWAAKKISEELENCEIVSMGSHKEYTLSDGYDVIGFVYPTYYRGLPAKVREFVSRLDLQNNKNAYYFAVATCGKVSCGGNSIVQLRNLLKRKGIALNYAEKLDMFSNYIIMYDMRDTVEEETRQSASDLEPIIGRIKTGTNRTDTRIEPFQQLAYKGLMHFAPIWISISMYPTPV